MNHYVTTCSFRYIPQLRVLIESMRRHCQPFRLHVLAWDPMPALGHDVEITPINIFLMTNKHYSPEALPGPPRLRLDEMMCTVRWQFGVETMYLVQAPITMVDADLMYWSSPEPFLEEANGKAIAVVPHRFAKRAAGLPGVCEESHLRYGRFNGGTVYFGDTAPLKAMAKLTWEWCYAGFRTHSNGRVTYGDQGVLELVVEKHGGHIVQHHGVDVGPWNIHSLPIEVSMLLTKPPKVGEIFVGADRLISYHYSSFDFSGESANAEYEITERQERLIYDPYRAELRKLGGL